MKVLRERWYVYHIDGEGRLRDIIEYAYGYSSLFNQYGYSTEQEAKDDILQKAEHGLYLGELTIIKTYQAVEKEDE